MPPTHSPLRLEAAILSLMRSEVTSRSNCANDSRTLSVIPTLRLGDSRGIPESPVT